MKQIAPSKNAHRWPRHVTPTIEARKRDLIFRIADWTRDKDEPAYDVETYIGGVYDWNESHVFSTRNGKEAARMAAVAFVKAQAERLL